MVYFDVWGGMLGILFGIDTFVLSLFLIFFYFCFCGVWEILFFKKERKGIGKQSWVDWAVGRILEELREEETQSKYIV